MLSLQLDFPAVTVCNRNRVDCSRLEEQLANCAEYLSDSSSDSSSCEFSSQPTQDGEGTESLARNTDKHTNLKFYLS